VRCTRRRLLGFGLAGLFAIGCHAPTQHLRIVDRSAHSSADEYAARRGIDLRPDERNLLAYELSSESFELYVPKLSKALDPARAQAGLVWVSAGRSGAPPYSWASALDRLGVIWIGANAAGNRRSPPDRINLALDAAEYLRGLLASDRTRVLVAGFSGGARIASEAALLYPDVFAGALFAGAADYFRYVRSSDPRFAAWEPAFPPPSADLLVLAKAHRRYVFLTGSDDFNRALVRDVRGAYLSDGFSFARLLDVPQLAHEPPPVACFERALSDLLSKKRVTTPNEASPLQSANCEAPN